MFGFCIDETKTPCYNTLTGNKTDRKEGGPMNQFMNRNSPKRGDRNRIIAICDQCGFAVYACDDARMIPESEDIIHTDCWQDYAEEHMFDLTTEVPYRDDDEGA